MTGPAKAAWAIIALVVLFFVFALLGGVLFQVGWNEGASKFLNNNIGAHVSKVSFWTSVFTSWFLQIVGVLVGTRKGSFSVEKKG